MSVKEYFLQYDPDLVEAKVLMDPQGRSRCFGYVTFSDETYAKAALANKDSHTIDGIID